MPAGRTTEAVAKGTKAVQSPRQRELTQEFQKHKGRPRERRDGNGVRLLSHEVQIHMNWTDVDVAGIKELR